MEAVTKGDNIQLLDCTLGVGGELVSWNFGKHEINDITQLLLRSGLEIIEYGLLSGFTSGPNCTVYCSTELPFVVERREGQCYALLLDQHSRPPLSQIPDRNKGTADIIRVYLTQKRAAAELQYCVELSRKGYQIAILVEETGQYTDEELSSLLHQVNPINPWGCYILDTSGILDENGLKHIFSIFDKELPSDTQIGFHGLDNLQRVKALAQFFCCLPTHRKLCVDVSAGGVGAGALHLSIADQAEWMNEFFETDYDLPVIEFLTTKTKQYVELKNEVCLKLLYHAAANQKCSYRYVEYYCGISVDPTVQLGVYSEIARECGFQFSKDEANKALLRYQKKRLDLTIVVLTTNRPKMIEQLLHKEADNLLKYGANIVIFDGSGDERTHAVTTNYQLEGYNNISYQRYSGDGTSASRDAMVKAAYATNLNHEYVWLLRDDLVPTISGFYHELLSQVKCGAEVIAIDAAFRNNNRFCTKIYNSNYDFFSDNSARLSMIGTCIVKSSVAERLMKYGLPDQSKTGFWMVDALLREIASEPVKTGLVVSNCFYYEQISFQQSFFNKDIMNEWGNCWYQTMMDLPEVYGPAKGAAVRIQMYDMHPFRLKSLLYLRASGHYSLSVYRRWKDRLMQISDTSKTKLSLVALFPRPLAKLILRVSAYNLAHQNSLFSKLASKLYHLYVRLGR